MRAPDAGSARSPGYRLYWYPGTCARVPFVALEEIGAPFEVSVVDRHAKPAGGQGANPTVTGGVADGNAYVEVNPKGKVPALVAEGRTITENPAIQIYLAKRHPEAGLLPDGDPVVELEVLETLAWFASGIHPPITRLRFPIFFTDVAEARAGIAEHARNQLEDAFAIVEERLEGRDWLFDGWTIADVYLLWLWFRATGSGMDGSKFPRCADHAGRCEQRPSVARVLDREEAEFARMRKAGQIPDFVPDYQVGRAPRPD